ncbi:MAG: TonB-dependent receptor, partial [Cytophagales bacterium]|nr:TonB-dependent receptor [Cytophagales bacterium]
MIKRFFLLFLIFLSFSGFSQKNVTVSGQIIDALKGENISYATVTLLKGEDSSFVKGTLSNESGLFTFENVQSGNYYLSLSAIGYKALSQNLFVGELSNFLDLNSLKLESDVQSLNEVVVTAQKDAIDNKMDKKVFKVADNISQSGGSVLQVLQNLPGITNNNGIVQLRGNDKVAVLIDGKQTALTGFGAQNGLDNIPASAIESIEIINNPSAKYDANGNAGIINIIYKQTKQEGFNGKVGLVGGLGALWLKKENLPNIRPQYQSTPKINPSISLNYKKEKTLIFLNSDYLYTQTLNKNEFVDRQYADGTIIKQQSKRNRNTTFITSQAGINHTVNNKNSFSLSGLFGTEKIMDNGDEPFFNRDLSIRLRLWQFLEDELKTTAMGTAEFLHQFAQPGHQFRLGMNYTFHREDEKYFFDNILPNSQSEDSFKLLSDEKVFDITADYVKPLKNGIIESGMKIRRRTIPTNMQFFPGQNSPLDVNAGGEATYKEFIPAIYSNYIYEKPKFQSEIGLRLEYVNLNYFVNPNHNTYKSDGYKYMQPFPNIRLGYKLTENSTLSLFLNRRVDRPNEVDIRIFPKYDDAEIIKVGNPALAPQFTNTMEIAYKGNIKNGYFYSALYHKIIDGTITRISTVVPGSTLIYNVFQNAGRSFNSGIEMVLAKDISKAVKLNGNLNVYRNHFNAFTVTNLYPVPSIYNAAKRDLISGNFKLNSNISFRGGLNSQVSATYLAPDLIPQGKIGSRFSLDIGLKKS